MLYLRRSKVVLLFYVIFFTMVGVCHCSKWVRSCQFVSGQLSCRHRGGKRGNDMKQYWNVYCNGVLAWNCRTKKEAEDVVILMKSLSIHENDNLAIKKGGLYG